jgi:O-acetylhomoserine/O-acetylserine sulfhydrylase-like pyridoxal-dependent enzyme
MGTTEGQLIDFQFALSNLNLESQGFDTLALHAGAFPDPTTGALLTPIYQTTDLHAGSGRQGQRIYLQPFG